MVDPLGVLGALTVGVIGLSSVLFFARNFGTHWPTISAFLIQAILGCGQYLFWGLRDDQLTYFNFANNLAIDLQANVPGAGAGISDGKQSFVWILAITFLVWGSSPLPGLVLNAVMLSSLPSILVATGRNLRLFTNGKVTAWISVVGPPILLWGPGLKREPLAFVLLALLLLGLSWAFQGRVFRSSALIVAVSLAIAVTRSTLIPVAVAVGVMAVSIALHRILFATGNSRQRKILSLDGRIIASMMVASAFLIMPLAFRIPQVRNVHGNIVELTEGQSTAVPNSSWDVEDSFLGLLEYVLRAFYNLGRGIVGPMPWEVVNLPLLVFFLDGAIYGLLILCVVVLYQSRRDISGKSVVTMLVVAASPLVVANFLYFANYGLTSRVRAHIFVMLLVVFEPVFTDKLGPWWRSYSKLRRFAAETITAANATPIIRETFPESRQDARGSRKLS
jgi:hypothetical protein